MGNITWDYVLGELPKKKTVGMMSVKEVGINKTNSKKKTDVEKLRNWKECKENRIIQVMN